MKAKAGKKEKGGNGQGTKRKTPTGAVDLLKMADHLSGLVQKAEGPKAAAKWAEKCLEEGRALVLQINDLLKKKKPMGDLGFKAVQTLREAGRMDDDPALAHLYLAFIHAGIFFPEHPTMKGKIDELCKDLDPENKKDMAIKGRVIMR